ncbi:hypothetical protein [Methanoregula sp.]|uniref:hypothetical protein n=1 Tax=Methanoregula sp. TaxID=2052170 RepID=UPI003BAF6288
MPLQNTVGCRAMKTNMPLSKPIRRLVAETEQMLDTEITLLRKPEAAPGGTLVDVYSYNVDKNVIIFPASYIGLLKDFVIAKQCTHLLIKGAAVKKSGYHVLSFTPDSVYTGMRQIYLDALKDEAKKDKKLPVKKLIDMLFLLYRQFHEDINELPWNPIVNARIYYRMEQLRKTQLYILLKDGKEDMDEMADTMEIIPRRYFVLDKSMFYARDLYLAKTLPADKLMPVVNIPQMKKFDHLEVKEMLTTRWTHTAWYQSKVFGDAMLTIMEKHLAVDWNAEPGLDYYADLYQTGVSLTNALLAYMTMKDWFIWEKPQHLLAAEEQMATYEKDALKKIFGDLIEDS